MATLRNAFDYARRGYLTALFFLGAVEGGGMEGQNGRTAGKSRRGTYVGRIAKKTTER